MFSNWIFWKTHKLWTRYELEDIKFIGQHVLWTFWKTKYMNYCNQYKTQINKTLFTKYYGDDKDKLYGVGLVYSRFQKKFKRILINRKMIFIFWYRILLMNIFGDNKFQLLLNGGW